MSKRTGDNNYFLQFYSILSKQKERNGVNMFGIGKQLNLNLKLGDALTMLRYQSVLIGRLQKKPGVLSLFSHSLRLA